MVVESEESKDGAEQTSAAEMLLRYGAKVNMANKEGQCALHLAAIQGEEGMVKVLLNAGANAALRDEGGMLPLHHACMHCPRRCVLLCMC